MGGTTCMARAFILRICFGTFLFHLILGVLTIGANNFSDSRVLLHTGLWPVKILLWVVLHLVAFFIPSSTFMEYKWAVLVFAVLFLLLQIVVFIEWIFELNESWLSNDGEDNLKGPWHMLIIAIAIIAYGGSITISGFMYHWFSVDASGSSSNCALFTFFTTFNIFLFLGLTLFSFVATSWMQATGLLPSALVSAFLTFKVLMALYAQNQCNALYTVQTAQGSVYSSPDVVNAISIVIAALMTAVSTIVLSQDLSETGLIWGPGHPRSTSSGSPALPGLTAAPISPQQDRQTPLLDAPATVIEMHAVPVGIAGHKADGSPASADAELAGFPTGGGEGPTGPVGYSISGFHLAFMLGICYVTMQLTDWNEDYAPTKNSNTSVRASEGVGVFSGREEWGGGGGGCSRVLPQCAC